MHVALTWVGRGCFVVPCHPGDKGAMMKGWGTDASPADLAPHGDAATVHAWWSGRYRRCHVGILCGPSGLVVIDQDTDDDGRLIGRESMTALASAAGATWPPEVYTVATPGGGEHAYYRQPADSPPIGCAPPRDAAGRVVPAVDVRGRGGLVIAAGSYSRIQGAPYRRISPPSARPGELSAWLVAALRPPVALPGPPPSLALPAGGRAAAYVASAIRQEVALLASLTDGRKRRAYTAALKLGGYVAAGVIDEGTVRAALLAAARQCGLPEREAARYITSGLTRARTSPRGVPA